MALSAADAATIAGWIIRHAGSTDTAVVARHIRSHWGGTGTDAQVIAAYADARADTDLVGWANAIRRNGGST